MKIERFDLKLVKPTTEEEYGQQHQPFYYLAGEEIKGAIELHVRERVRIARLSLRLLGSSHTNWQDDFTDIVYESKELFLDEYKDLTSDLSVYCNEAMEILWGDHKIDFSIVLPKESLSSIEKEAFGCVKYSIMATLDIPEDGGDSEIVAETELFVRSFLSLDSPHFLEPAQSTEQMLTNQPFPLACFRKQRWLRASLCVSSLGLLPGEICTISLAVENSIKKANAKKHSGDQHHCALILLCQQVDFKARAKNNPHVWDWRSLTTAVQSQGICKANYNAGAETRQIAFQIPADIPPTTTKENGLIACSYFFRIEVEEHFDVIVPVVIGSHKTQEINFVQ